MADPRDLIDAALELSVIGSFSDIGYAVRRRLYGWADPAPGALRGRTVLITGPTSGLGQAASRVFAGLGARLVLVGRDADKLEFARTDLTSAYPDADVDSVVADMSSLAIVSDAAQAVRATQSRLDVLVDNAGAIHERRIVTADGLEATFATMVVGPFRFVAELLPLLQADTRGRRASSPSRRAGCTPSRSTSKISITSPARSTVPGRMPERNERRWPSCASGRGVSDRRAPRA